ncbi:MAG: hypothetical protein JRE16_11470 [Deltaproteobacteria bacterium]|jgi:hypothetical protein|nr:hypothetical protein [Deltaproteobacteria bacterium]
MMVILSVCSLDQANTGEVIHHEVAESRDSLWIAIAVWQIWSSALQEIPPGHEYQRSRCLCQVVAAKGNSIRGSVKSQQALDQRVVQVDRSVVITAGRQQFDLQAYAFQS